MEKRSFRLFARDVGQKGMTLIEILIVITILGIVMTLVGSRVVKQFGRAKIKTTTLAMQQLRQAITEYQMDHNKIPSDLAVLEGEYTETLPADGWGNAFRMQIPGPTGQPFDIISDGPDGQAGTEDDIKLSDQGKK